MLLDFIFDVALVVVGSLLILLVLFVALPGLVLYAFRRWRVDRNEEEASGTPRLDRPKSSEVKAV